MKRRFVVAVSSAAVFGFALVGCSGGSGNGASASTSSASTAPAAGVKVVVDKARSVQNEVECVTAANTVWEWGSGEHSNRLNH